VDPRHVAIIHLDLSLAISPDREYGMRRDIIVVDNFYSDPDAVVRFAYDLEYVFPYSQPGTPEASNPISWRASRYRSARDCVFKSSSRLVARLAALTGDEIDIDSWRREFPVDAHGYPADNHHSMLDKSAWWNCCFHVKHDQNQQLGAGVHSHTDADSWNPVGLDGWAGLLYLNKDPLDRQGGLRTWDNRDPGRQHDWMTAKDHWILRDTFANVYNRLILHRGCVPHSGGNGWGDSLRNGRLYQTFFFRIVARAELPAVSFDDLHFVQT
jgi:hypothetical protein